MLYGEVFGVATQPATLPSDASQDHEVAAGPRHLGQRRLQRANDPEHVRLELPTIVIECEAAEAAHHAEAGVGNGDVELAPLANGLGDGTLEVAVPGDIALEGERAGGRWAADLCSQRAQLLAAPRGQGQARACRAELARELLADAGGGAGDEHRLVVKVRVRAQGVALLGEAGSPPPAGDYLINSLET